MSNNGVDDPQKDKSWLHSDIYDRPRTIKNPIPRTSIFKFGSLRDVISNTGKLVVQSLISGFLFAFLLLLLIDPIERKDDQYFLVISEIVKLVCVTVSVFLVIRIFDESDIADIGLKLDRGALSDFLFGFSIVFLILTLEFLFELATGWIKIERVAWEVLSFASMFWNAFTTLIIFIFVGWSEELLSRGFHLRIISKGFNRPLGIILSSAIFSYMHHDNPEMTPWAFIFIFLAGMIMSLAFLRTGQLWLAIGLHTGWDFFGGVIFGKIPPIFGSGIFHLMETKLTLLPSPIRIFEIPELIIIAIMIYFYTTSRKPEILDW